MIKQTILKISVFLFTFSFLLIAGFQNTQAQGFLSDPLNFIKERLGEEKIEVIDFSEAKKWGNLPKETIAVLKDQGFTSLQDLNKDFEDNKIPPEDQVKTLEGFDLTNDQANFVINEIRFSGESQLNSVIFAVVNTIRNLMLGLAIVFIVIAGLRMIMAQGEETPLTEQKKGILYAVLGMAAILLIERLVYVIYGLPGTPAEITEPPLKFSEEILGVVAYLKSLIAILATFMVIINGFRMVVAMGEEEVIKKQRAAVLWVAVGLIIVIINRVIVENLFILPHAANPDSTSLSQGNVAAIIALLGTIMKFALGFVGVIALAALIYGAGLFVANYASEELAEKAKKIIKHALMGIVVILTAFALVATLIDFK